MEVIKKLSVRLVILLMMWGLFCYAYYSGLSYAKFALFLIIIASFLAVPLFFLLEKYTKRVKFFSKRSLLLQILLIIIMFGLVATPVCMVMAGLLLLFFTT